MEYAENPMLKPRFSYIDLVFLGAVIGYLSVPDYWAAVIGAVWSSNSHNS